MPEITQEALEQLQRSYDLLQKLNGDPNTRPQLETAIKHHYPQVQTEAEKAAQIVTPVLERFRTEHLDPLANELKARREREEAADSARVETGLTEAFTDISRKRGFTDDGIEAIKKLMVDRSIADPYAAAALFAEQNPAPKQDAPSWTPAGWNLEQTASDFDVKGLFANEDAWADNMAAKTLNEIRVGQAA